MSVGRVLGATARLLALLLLAGALGGVLVIVLSPLLLSFSDTAVSASAALRKPVPPLPALTLPERNHLVAADGSTVALLYEHNRINVELSQVAPAAVEAVLAVEDAGFYEHSGVDYRAIARAAAANRRSGEVEQGASTITQQYVKNVRLLAAQTPAERSAAVEQTPERKRREVLQALALERSMTKTEILTGYLNIAYFGNGAYGIEAASRYYFGVSAAKLSAHQGALLAGLVKNPVGFDPRTQPRAALDRRAVVLRRMAEEGHISAQEQLLLTLRDLGLRITPVPNGCTSSSAPFFCDWVLEELRRDPALGRSPEERAARIARGGLRITTSLDPRAQRAAQQALRRVPPQHRVAAALVAVDPRTGGVRAMAANRGFGTGVGETHVPLPSRPAYQPGSTFKTFTLVAALEAGLSPDTRIQAPEFYRSVLFDNPPSGGYRNAAEGEGGNLSLEEATWHSVNTYYVQLLERVGVARTAEVAHRMGITSIPREGPGKPGRREGSFTLGTREVSPLELASAYGVLAAEGRRCAPHGIGQILDADRTELGNHRPQCAQVVSREVAQTATAILQGVPTQGTGRAAAIGRPVAGKTGTTQSFGAAWFAGYTPDLSTSVWLGDPRGPSHPLVNVLGERRIYGGGIPTQIWASMMRETAAGTPVRSFAPGPSRTQSSSSMQN